MSEPLSPKNAEGVGMRTSEAPFAAASGYAEKPPLGIIPRKLCVVKRLHEIVEAIGRYNQGQYTIPVEWFEEAAEIGRWLERNTADPGHSKATKEYEDM